MKQEKRLCSKVLNVCSKVLFLIGRKDVGMSGGVDGMVWTFGHVRRSVKQ